MSEHERSLAEAIYAAITSDESIAEAVLAWKKIGYPAWATEARDMRSLLSHVAGCAIDRVLARRQREIARTGPWDGPP
jgi:D-alanyl-D-alanine dipeptidase